MRKANPLILISILIGMGTWLVWNGDGVIVLFVIAGFVGIMAMQLAVGGILVGIGKLLEKRKNRK
jgi:hypothetical protein